MTEEKIELLKITSKSDASVDETITPDVFVKHTSINGDAGLQKNKVVEDAWEKDVTVLRHSHQQLMLDNMSKCSLSKSEVERGRANLRSLIVSRNIRHFFSSTSFHGLPVIGTTKSICCGLTCWIVPIFLALGIMLWALISVTRQYSEKNTVLFSKVEFNRQLLFPAVTICNKNYFRKSVAESTGIDLDELVMFLNVISGDPFYTDFNFTQFYKEHEGTIGEDNSKFFFNNSGHQIRQMIYSCKFGNEYCLDNFVQRSSYYGNCYTFNSGINKPLLYNNRHGYRYGLELILNAEEYEYFVAESDSVGFDIIIHHQEHFPYHETIGAFSVTPGQQTQIALRKVEYSLLTENSGGQCTDGVSLKYFKSYSYSSCIAECLTDIVVNTCGCKGQTMPGPADVCNVSYPCQYDMTTYFDERLCSCPVPCEYTMYEKTFSYSNFPASHFAGLLRNSDFLSGSFHFDFPGFIINTTVYDNGTVFRYLNENFTTSFLRNNMVKLRIYYDTLGTVTMTEGLEYSTFQFIADFGGHIGLFTGAGFLTIFEIIHLCFGFILPIDDLS